MAITAKTVWLDGELLPNEGASLSLMAHAAQRGSLVFDVGSFHPTPRGPALFRAQEHVARLLRSARLVGLEVASDDAALVAAARAVVAACEKDEGLVRWSVFFAAREPDFVPRETRARVAVAAQLYEDPPKISAVRLATFDDARKASPHALDPSIKAAAAYLGPMLARRRAVRAGADEILLLDEDGFVAEAPTANVFAVVSGALWTPPLRYVLAGITRDTTLELARSEGLTVREEPLPLAALADAEEAFLTSTSLPIAPVASLNGRAYPAAPGDVTSRLIRRLTAIQSGRDEAFDRFLTPVHG
jgi:branched-chain amino acid aminotransferase